MKTEQRFQIFCPSITKSKSDSSDYLEEPLILKGIVSTTSVDLEGDYMTPNCISSMKKQLGKLNIHADHLNGLNGVIGSIIKVLDTDEDSAEVEFSILPSFRKKIEEFLDYGVNLGLSIGGDTLDYEYQNDGWKIDDVILYEISLTPLPANWDSFGSVTRTTKSIVQSKCFNGACKQIVKNMTGDINKDMNSETKEDNQIKQELIDLVNEACNGLEERIMTVLKEDYRIDDLKQRLIIDQAQQNQVVNPSNENQDNESEKPTPEEGNDKPEDGDQEDKVEDKDDDEEDDTKKEKSINVNVNDLIDMDKIVKDISEQVIKNSTETILKELSVNREPSETKKLEFDFKKNVGTRTMNRKDIAKLLAN